MGAEIVQAEYDALDGIAGRFNRSAEVTDDVRSQLGSAFAPLERGGWIGDAAQAFFGEMRGELFPAVQRLTETMSAAQEATLRIAQIIREAEEEASAQFNDWRIDGALEVGGATGGATPVGGAGPDPAVTQLHNPERDTPKGPFMYSPTYGQFAGSVSVDGFAPGDIKQGLLGDCYFLSALTTVAIQHPEILEKAIKDNGDGTYTVTFQKNGKPVEVTVDNDFPVTQDAQGNPTGNAAYVQPGSAPTELWPMIMEKAFATHRNNSYAVIEGGFPEQAVELLTGQSGSRLNLRFRDAAGEQAALQKIADNLSSGNYVTAASRAMKAGEDAASWPANIVPLHAYTVDSVDLKAGTIQLRNPWGEAFTPEPITLAQFNNLYQYMAANKDGID